MTISITFGAANHGWLPCRLSVNQQEFDLSVSYTPNDFILDLVNALSGALTWEGTYVAMANQEPVQSDWVFNRAPNGLVFSTIQYSDHRRGRGNGRKLAECSGDLLEIALPFWRALRELDTRWRGEHFEMHWRRPFPSSDLEKLTAEVERLKRESRSKKQSSKGD